MTDTGGDPRALEVARRLQAATDADRIVLFGSRARSDWTGRSDVDLMVLDATMPTQAAILATQDRAREIAEEVFGETTRVDVLFMTHEEYGRMSQHTVNHIAARARREGVIVPGRAEEYGSSHEEEHPDEQLEYVERNRRVANANLHYRNLHTLLDMEFEDKETARHAQQAVEHAMKAMISAMGKEYNTHHSLRALARDIRQFDREAGRDREWDFASNLGLLENFAGGGLYEPDLVSIPDFQELANNVTLDLEMIYERIGEATGDELWGIPPEGNNTQRVEPRWRNNP